MIEQMRSLVGEVSQALATQMTWTQTEVGAMRHWTGRGEKWVIQLVVLPGLRVQRMGTATAGGVVMKLPDELAALAEEYATGVRK